LWTGSWTADGDGLRPRGCEVHGFGKDKRDVIFQRGFGCKKSVSLLIRQEMSVADLDTAKRRIRFDFECTGYSLIIFDAMQSFEMKTKVLISVKDLLAGGNRKMAKFRPTLSN